MSWTCFAMTLRSVEETLYGLWHIGAALLVLIMCCRRWLVGGTVDLCLEEKSNTVEYLLRIATIAWRLDEDSDFLVIWYNSLLSAVGQGTEPVRLSEIELIVSTWSSLQMSNWRPQGSKTASCKQFVVHRNVCPFVTNTMLQGTKMCVFSNT